MPTLHDYVCDEITGISYFYRSAESDFYQAGTRKVTVDFNDVLVLV